MIHAWRVNTDSRTDVKRVRDEGADPIDPIPKRVPPITDQIRC